MLAKPARRHYRSLPNRGLGLNQLIWTEARAVGTELRNHPISGIAKAFGVHGVTVAGSLGALEAELRAAAERQTESTLIEVICTPEMGAPFRSDAMSYPERHMPKYWHLTADTADFKRQYKLPAGAADYSE